MRILKCIIFPVIIFPYSLPAQFMTYDTAYISNHTIENAINQYDETIGRNARIYTGSYYFDKNLGINGHPFFQNNYWETGSIIYENQRYDSVELRYDVYRDLVLVKHIDKEGFINLVQLKKSKVEGFIMNGHHFIQLEEDTLSGLSPGFYDLLLNGEPLKAIARRKKEINRIQGSGNQIRGYVDKDKYYIKSGGVYYPVNRKKTMYNVLSERKNEIRIFLKRNKSRLRRDYEKKLVEAVRYYNALAKKAGS